MVDRSEHMEASPAPRREAWLVVIAVALIALLYRYAWLPSDPAAALQHARDTLGLPVMDVSGWFSAWTLGDGQIFAIIATDPLGLDEGWLLTQPAYRYGRAGFGWLAWVASLGQAEWVPYGMAIVGALAVTALFLLAWKLRPVVGRSAWLIVLNPAVFIGFAGDTAETLGVLALAWAIATGQLWASAALGVIRPSFLVGLVGRWRLLTSGVISAVVLGFLLIARFGFRPEQYGEGIALPLLGYITEPSPQSIVLGLLALTTLGVGLRRRDWGWVTSGAFVLCFSPAVLQDVNNGWRAAGMLFVLWAFGPGYAPNDRAHSVSSPAAELPSAYDQPSSSD